jgi:hypothetical protein
MAAYTVVTAQNADAHRNRPSQKSGATVMAKRSIA